ncbi:hypothetical protein C8R45DRAFT_1186800 [Mycena sanguinolenta]|nr:hypothetical protein C8R45DRAFT_1186800 [Mycena sanguinolenta]
MDLSFAIPPSSEFVPEGSAVDVPFDPQFIDLLMLPGEGPNYYVPDAFPVDNTHSESLMLPDATMQTGWGPTNIDELLASNSFAPPNASAPDHNSAIYVGISGDEVSQLPALPAPPSPSIADSPSPYLAPLPATRKRRAEVDAANIIHSARPRTRSVEVRENEDGLELDLNASKRVVHVITCGGCRAINDTRGSRVRSNETDSILGICLFSLNLPLLTQSASHHFDLPYINPHLGPPFGLSSSGTSSYRFTAFRLCAIAVVVVDNDPRRHVMI